MLGLGMASSIGMCELVVRGVVVAVVGIKEISLVGEIWWFG